MKTYLLTVDDSQEGMLLAVAKALKIELQPIGDDDEDWAMLKAMEEGKQYGRLSDEEARAFLDNLGK